MSQTNTSASALLLCQREVKSAIHDTFGMFLGEAPTEIPTQKSEQSEEAILGMLSFSGEWDWSLTIGFSRSSAASFATLFAGFEIEFDSADMGDAIGEVANVLAGDIRAKLEAKGDECSFGLPSIIRGTTTQSSSPQGVDSTTLTYLFEDQPFWVELLIETDD